MGFTFLRLLVFHFDISGNDIKDVQFANIKSKFLILLVFQFIIFGINDIEEQL